MTDEHDETEVDDLADQLGDRVAAALAQCPRDDDGNVAEDVLVKVLAAGIDIDIDRERQRRAKALISRASRPGSTDPAGQLQMFDTYPYEPLRLVRDDNGNVVEQHRAQPDMKAAEARRARLNVQRAQVHAERKTVEAEEHSKWVLEQVRSGVTDKTELTFDAFVKSTGRWSE